MTDKDIIKALEVARYHLTASKHKDAIDNALDLINRQQAEIERLKAPTNDWLVKGISKEQLEQEKIEALIDNAKKCAKAEAVKEFAERLKAVSHPYADSQMVFELQIDNLLKEMVGEGK